MAFAAHEIIILVWLHFDQGYLVDDLIVIRIRRNMLRPTLRPSAESFVQKLLDATLIEKGSNTDILRAPSYHPLRKQLLGTYFEAPFQISI